MKCFHFASLAAIAWLVPTNQIKCAHADELNELPSALPAPTSLAHSAEMPGQAPAARISSSQTPSVESTVPSYSENGVLMVPLKPLALLLDLDVRNVLGVILVTRLSQGSAQVAPLRLALRNGAAEAQIESSGATRNFVLPVAVQTRFGNTFVPARAFASLFGATLQNVIGKQGAVIVFYKGHHGKFARSVQSHYRGQDAAHVTITNNVGRALSLRLNGPRNVSIELGPRERITCSMFPGYYTFQAASAGMKTRQGKRRFSARQRANWNWERQK